MHVMNAKSTKITFSALGRAEKMGPDKCYIVLYFDCLMHQGNTFLALEMLNMNLFNAMMEKDLE